MESRIIISDLVITEFSKKIGLVLKLKKVYNKIPSSGIYCEVLIEEKIMLIPLKNLTKI